MRWKLKARIQNAVAMLPASISYDVYYRLQRVSGALRWIDPTSRLEAGVSVWRRLLDAGADPVGKTFFEVGTGRMVNAPLAYWLMGAERTITVDLNPYLKSELVREAIRFIALNKEAVASVFGELLREDRLEQVTGIANGPSFDLRQFLDRIGVEHHAPANAAATWLPEASIDFHTSFTVMEHIPPDVLSPILAEGRRILRPGGFAVHGVDYSDHFSHSDQSITAVNFLQFSPEEWDRWAGNRYMYMNRLRHRDYLRMFRSNALRVESEDSVLDDRSLHALESGEVTPHATYTGLPPDELAITSSWIVAQPEAAA